MTARSLPQDFALQEQQLLDVWRQRIGEPFFDDGAVDRDAYQRVPTRIVFVLREVNDPDAKKGWPFRQFLREGAKVPRPYSPLTWCNVARWTYGLLRGLPPDPPRIADLVFRRTWLRWVAVVNLNKKGGGSVTARSRLQEAAVASADLLRRQIELLDPDVVVCGGTGNLFRRVLGEVPWPIIDADHPAARKHTGAMHARLVEQARACGWTW